MFYRFTLAYRGVHANTDTHRTHTHTHTHTAQTHTTHTHMHAAHTHKHNTHTAHTHNQAQYTTPKPRDMQTHPKHKKTSRHTDYTQERLAITDRLIDWLIDWHQAVTMRNYS